MMESPAPFWQRAGSAELDARRLLVVSYHFPPDITIGARRWEKLAHAVTARGWGLDVITRAPESDIGESLDSLPAGVRVYGVPDPVLAAERLEHLVWRGYRTLIPNRHLSKGAADAPGAGKADDAQPIRAHPDSIARVDIRPHARTPRELLRTYWAWLDFTHGMRWARRAAALAQQILERGVHEAIITSAPPHMSHEAGRIVSLATGLPFVMDMRDPWSLQPWLRESVASALWYRNAEYYEYGCVRQASLVVANTAPAREALAALYPDASRKIIAVMNGSDEDPLPPHRDRGRFVIAYAGTIYLDRDPQRLFQAAAKVIRAERLTPAQFSIDILGRFDAEERIPMLTMAAQEGIAAYVTVEPPRPHRAALEFLAGATMLVVFPGSNAISIPAKVFEYVRFDAWLLAVAEPSSAVSRLLEGTKADVVPLDADAIAAAITARYRDYLAGVRPTRVASDDRFSRSAQARILLDAIARLNSSRAASI